MKNIQTLFSAVACGLALTLTASAQGLQQGVASVIRVQGEASYTLGGGDGWHPLVAGKILQAGSTISTKPDASVDVVLGKMAAMPQARPTPTRISAAADSPVRGMIGYKPSVEQNVVRLSGGTTLKIDVLTVSDTGVDTVSDTELDLQAGRIFASVKKLSSESKYLVKIPNGIAGVRGTKFALAADGSCACIESSVLLSIVGSGGGAPSTIEVGAGNQFDPGSGQTSPIPAALASTLKQLSLAAGTSFLELVSYAANQAQYCYVSPTTGYYPHFPLTGGNNH